jgi:hypothetical protein
MINNLLIGEILLLYHPIARTITIIYKVWNFSLRYKFFRMDSLPYVLHKLII